jgi:predicted metal-binding membrane protein
MLHRIYCGRDRVFFGISTLLFAASATMTILWGASMSAMRGMAMPGDWTMSMMWMRMPGQTWADSAVSFLGMWVVMMAAMMLPSLVSMLWRYRETLGRTHNTRLGRLTLLVGTAYFGVWTAVGIVAFALGIASSMIAMQFPSVSRAVPLAAGVVVTIAGALQFTTWKTHHLACCQRAPWHDGVLQADARAAWRYGQQLGMHCVKCCAGLTAILLVVGVMDLRAMTVVATGITIERLPPAAERVARVIGIIVVVAGLFLVARAIGVSGLV